MGILANGLILLVIWMSGKKQFSTYKYFISHLALSDFLASVMSMVYFPLELHQHNWIYARLVQPMIVGLSHFIIRVLIRKRFNDDVHLDMISDFSVLFTPVCMFTISDIFMSIIFQNIFSITK